MKVLVADDDPVYRRLLARILGQWRYEPAVVDNGEAAWQALNAPGSPQIAILDWMMPEAHGVEVCRRLRAATLPYYVYVVLLTSRTDEADILAGLEAGADDYLPKPVHFHHLKLRLRAAERVLQAERRRRQIAEIASDGIVTMDDAGIIQFANTAAGAIFGYSAAQLTGRPFSELAPGFARRVNLPDTEAALTEAPAPARTWAPIEMIGRHRSGKLAALEVSFAEAVEGQDETLITTVIRNVTERKARDSQFAHAQKLESIGQLASGVAHEINTPIQYVSDNLRFVQDSFRSMSQLLEASQRSVEELSRLVPQSRHLDSLRELREALDLDYLASETPPAIEQAIEGAARVAEIVRALKEFSHPGAETAEADLNRLLRNAALVSRNRWKYVTELKLQLDENLPPVRCLSGELNQVFLNLIVNAADAIASAVEEQPGRKGDLVVTTRRDGEFVEIRVRDNGTGIPREVQPKVFVPFFTTKGVGAGTGQGLAIAYAIVAKKHRGSIEFETEPGVGTTFIVRLPIGGPEAVSTADAKPNRVCAAGCMPPFDYVRTGDSDPEEGNL